MGLQGGEQPPGVKPRRPGRVDIPPGLLQLVHFQDGHGLASSHHEEPVLEAKWAVAPAGRETPEHPPIVHEWRFEEY